MRMASEHPVSRRRENLSGKIGLVKQKPGAGADQTGSEAEGSEGGHPRRPRVFIGSSKEGLEIAETIQLNLDNLCEVTIWTQGHFALGSTTLGAVTEKLQEFDFAILVLTPDDLTESRGGILLSPRDNVVFELGLFMASLGLERTILVYDRTSDLKIPSDLAGVTAATFQPHTSGNLDAALGAPCTRLKKHIKVLGARRESSRNVLRGGKGVQRALRGLHPLRSKK